MTQLTGLFERNPALFSGKYIEYGTPKKLYKELDDEFHFDLDPCTTPDNPLQARAFFTKEDDGLKKPWWMCLTPLGLPVKSVYVNPPYGRDIGMWVEKCSLEAAVGGLTVVMLLPARTDTRWFHQYIYNDYKNDYYDNVKVRWIRGRLKFTTKEQAPNTAPFPSMIVIFGGKKDG